MGKGRGTLEFSLLKQKEVKKHVSVTCVCVCARVHRRVTREERENQTSDLRVVESNGSLLAPPLHS